jgi:hypothetical protein
MTVKTNNDKGGPMTVPLPIHFMRSLEGSNTESGKNFIKISSFLSEKHMK